MKLIELSRGMKDLSPVALGALQLAEDRGIILYDHAFGVASKGRLVDVLPALVDVAQVALRISPHDATIPTGGGLRNAAQAALNVARGTGILDSRHRKQKDGWGHAIDLPPLDIRGKIDWTDLPAFMSMAYAVRIARALLGVPIRQGCDWNMNGIFAEKNEHDWAHFEDPLPQYLPKACELMVWDQETLHELILKLR